MDTLPALLLPKVFRCRSGQGSPHMPDHQLPPRGDLQGESTTRWRVAACS